MSQSWGGRINKGGEVFVESSWQLARAEPSGSSGGSCRETDFPRQGAYGLRGKAPLRGKSENSNNGNGEETSAKGSEGANYQEGRSH